MPRLSAALGREIFVKRDDSLGPGLGGNKTRKLEYLLPEALQHGSRRVVTFGGLQSNHARLTAAAARLCGLEPHLFYFTRRPPRLTGNLLVNELLGAKMHFIRLGGDSSAPRSLEGTIQLVRWLARFIVGPHYFIPVGGHSALGCLGYVRAALELDEQARLQGLGSACVVLAAGTGGTLAGLLAGFALLGSPLRLAGIDVGKLWKGFPASVARLAGEICRLLGSVRAFTPQDVPLIEERYVGPCYGVPSQACQSALDIAGRSEGLLLDPIYTGKAFAGLLDLVEREDPLLGQKEPVIFLHTGGLPALFAFDELE
jgi:1-aminocyclopropane-1-carboxylate deaminase/D-cysteine desulfhydrase-like pyridoxal-dependent ACC family enzyme